MDKLYHFKRMEHDVRITSPAQALEFDERGPQKHKRNNPLARTVWFPWATKQPFPYDFRSQIKLSPPRETFVIIIKSVKCSLEKY